ncbi:kasugamycin N-acetyltransferase AAC(2')-IIb [Paenibacillus mesophilus]|uniref:kasugamycin N-acetyltransferase AAC(2')-IIb n=1 Tax=Paenibacillus mesophilus TaxID=2582849 RepID=UPI00110D47C3|nr:kasugamycin N-acetyltransferase AAC(2')-IIb [Paenibacillus mesophilus]TMV46251.1 kasugamycin N-acetyltransferase AAC(2')-IIb [Paenibacillus mesophilus]
MSDRGAMNPTAQELMVLHAEAMFTYDRNMRLRTVNEPWPGESPAPRFFMGRTMEGSALCRFRYDVPETLVEQLNKLCADEPVIRDLRTRPKHFDAYMSLLQSDRYTMGPCYRVPDETVPNAQVVSITRDNRDEYLHGGFEWLKSEIDYAQPCMALVNENKAVSICRSVRISPGAHEAGLETLNEYRGRGYAAAVVAGWAMAVREIDGIPLYSTSWDNLSSQSVARQLALSVYGVNFTIH